MPEVYWKESYLLISVHMLEGQGSLDNFFKNKRAGGGNFSLPSPSLNTQIPTQCEPYPPSLLITCLTHILYYRPACSILALAGVFWVAAGPLLQQNSTPHSPPTLSPEDLSSLTCHWQKCIHNGETNLRMCKQAQQGPTLLQSNSYNSRG